MSKHRGFTLLELMIVLAVAGILSAVIFSLVVTGTKTNDTRLNTLDNTRCRGGVLTYRGQVVITNGHAVTCGQGL